eukprot:12590148-Heterocapsa_arctica.AAC.1
MARRIHSPRHRAPGGGCGDLPEHRAVPVGWRGAAVGSVVRPWKGGRQLLVVRREQEGRGRDVGA